VWRGTLEAATLREFLADVAWGTLDQLFVDLPPGMQRFAELTELVPEPPAVLTVTIPTVESRDAVRRAMRHAVECGATLLGVVENMAGGPLTGSAAADLSAEFAVPVLARIPWHPGAETWDRLAERL
jgi:ATP-binding protein involved in chromosome partitioning